MIQPNTKEIDMELTFGEKLLIGFVIVVGGLWEMGKKAVQSDAAKHAAGGFLRGFFK